MVLRHPSSLLTLHYAFIIFASFFVAATDGLGNINGKCRRGAVTLSYVNFEPPLRTRQRLPPIILLHGILDSKKSWTHLVPKLAEFTGRKVYALDMRNHGESTWTEEFNVDALSNDLDCFFQEHYITKATLVGHSLGAKTIMSFALKKPEKVEKVVFEDMVVKNLDTKDWQQVETGLETIRRAQYLTPNDADEMTLLNTFGAAVISSLAPEESSNLSPETAGQVLKILPIGRTPKGHYFWQGNLDVLEKAITTPRHMDQCLKGTYYGDALFIYGTKSFINVPADSSIRKHFPYAQFVPVDGASHLVHHFHPKEYLAYVVNFINSPSSADVQQFVQYQF